MNKELLQLLACPRCRGTLELVEEHGQEQGLSCAACAVLYPIRDSIPVMLVEEALPLHTINSPAPQDKCDPHGGGSCACS